MSLEAGQKLAAYEIIEPLGAGGMGEVYRARDTKLDRDVAIKVLPPGVASNTERRHRFEREAKTVAALNHPNIVTIFGIEEADGHYFIAMELVQGDTLDRLIPATGMPLTRIFDLAIPLADALTAAHEKGIIHRDLKPGNVMVTKEGRVKILDFGLAKLTTGGPGSSSPDAVTMTASLTGQGMIVGTVPYMSPEQLRSAAVDHRTDIFSLGIMLYQMATGHRPFRGEQSADVMSSILRDTPRPLHEMNTSLPRHLGRIVRRCLDKDPEQRYQSAKEVRNELTLLRKEVDSGDDLSESQEAATPAAPAAPPSSNASLVPSGSTMSAPTRRGEFWIGVAAVIAVLVVGIWYVRETITSDASSATKMPTQVRSDSPADSIDSLAVLPFAGDSADEDTAFLGDGIAESVINRLITIPALHVVSRNTAFRHRGRESELEDVARELNVRGVLTGTVFRRGERLVVSVALEDMINREQIWGERFDCKMADILTLERDIADRITAALRVTVSGDDSSDQRGPTTENPDARLAYMQGRFWWNKRTSEGFKKSIEYYDRAIDLDPAYALPYAGKATTYVMLAWYTHPPKEVISLAKRAAERAIALDPELAEAYTPLAWIQAMHEWDWSTAESTYRKAIDLNPRYETARHWYGVLLTCLGRFDDAEVQLQEALRLDPGSLIINRDVATPAYFRRNFALAEQRQHQALALYPNNLHVRIWLCRLYLVQQRFDEAVAAAREIMSLDNKTVDGLLGYILGLAGRRSEALEALSQLEDIAKRRQVSPTAFAMSYAGLGDMDRAFEYLDQAIEERDGYLALIKFDPTYDPFRHDPRFDRLLERIGFPADPPAPVVEAWTPQPKPSRQPPALKREQQQETRLAILPFTDNSPHPQPWLASGLADLVSMRLGRINPSKLGVVGPQSTTYYAQPGKSIQDLREELKVEFVLSGSIQTIGNDVRITASLINADNSTLIWSEEFKGTMDDSFALQSMVAEKIMAGLPVELTGDDQVRWKNRYVPDPTAELAYMRGRYFAPWAGRVENQSRAVSYFEQAIEKDPQYALAYCGLADTKCFLATWGTLQTSDIRGETMETVTEALALDDTLAEAHTSAGLVATFVNWDWAAAEAAFERAIELNPNIARTYDDYGRLLAIVGRYDEAEERYQQAIDLNPVSSSHLSGLGVLYAGIGRLEEADTLLQEALEFDEKNPEASVWLADVRQKQGRFDDAVKIMERAVFSVDHPELAMRSFLGIAYAMAGRIDDARKQLAEMHESKEEVPGHHVWFAELYAALGEKNEAFRRLDLALAAREAWLPHVRFDPGTVSIRSDPRFAELHRKMGIGDVDLSYAAPESVRQSLQLQPRQPQKARVAILPFTDNSPRPELKPWLASGLADKISTQLGRVNPKKLGVLGPEITKHYAQTDRPIQNLRADLTVDSVLSGSIQAHGNDVSITARLINAHDQTSVWSDEFKGTMDDPFALQSKVAEKIIAGLPFQLTGEERGRFDARYVPDPKAEVAYMRGLFVHQWEATNEHNLLRAVSFFEQAIEIDPDYPLPYCGLVDAKCMLTTWGRLQASQIRSELDAAVARALSLDATLPEAHVSAAMVDTYLDWDWAGAEAAFKRAIQLDPNLANAFSEYGHMLRVVGRYDEAQQRFEEAIRLNPVSSVHQSGLGMVHVALGRLGVAEQLFQEAYELNPDRTEPLIWLADVRQKQERFDDAVEIMEEAVLSKEKPELALRAFLGNAYAMAGRMEDARQQLAEMQKSRLPGHHMWFGELHAALGEVDEAFRRLDLALEAREAWLPHIRLDPGLIHIRGDLRFAELHRKMGLANVDLSYAAPSDWTAIDPGKKTMLAVLPFANLSGDPQQEYFSDGMTEEMITRLGRLRPEQLGVIARTSAMRYKRTIKSIDQIGQELGVDYIIEGGVLRAGDSVRINAQLIQVSDQTQIWGDSYTRALSDVFAIQTEVAEAVAESLAVKLLSEDKAAPSEAPTDISDAYHAYLLGRHYWAKRTPEALYSAIDHFKRAVEVDPNYALAYCGLADAWGVLPWYVSGPYEQMYAEARTAAERALALDEGLAEAHVSMANVLAETRRPAPAELHFQRALALDPNNATAHHWYGIMLSLDGRQDAAIRELEHAISLDPLSAVMHEDYCFALLLARRLDESVDQCNRALELNPESFHAVGTQAWTSIGNGDLAAAATWFEKYFRLLHVPEDALTTFRRTCHAQGLRAGLLNLLASSESGKAISGRGPGVCATLYAWCDEKDEAFKWLDRALESQDPYLLLVESHRAFDSLHDDPRWDDFLRRAGLNDTAGSSSATEP